MRFDVGWFDRLFGEKIETQLTTSDGEVIKHTVTKKWLEKMEAEGKITKTDSRIVSAHIHDTFRGHYVAQWVVGKDIGEDVVNRFIDPGTNSIYVISYYKEGQQEMSVIQKSLWDQHKAEVDNL